MKKIALSGNIGCGKSYVAKIIESHGVFVLDCDKIAAMLRKQYKVEIAHLLSMDAKDNKSIANIVFHDQKKQELLEGFLYPKILDELEVQFKARVKDKIIVVEVPLVYEKGWEKYFDEVWIVACCEETSILRMMEERNYTKEEVRLRLSKQFPIEEKIKRADYVFENNLGSRVDLQIIQKLEKEGV